MADVGFSPDSLTSYFPRAQRGENRLYRNNEAQPEAGQLPRHPSGDGVRCARIPRGHFPPTTLEILSIHPRFLLPATAPEPTEPCALEGFYVAGMHRPQ